MTKQIVSQKDLYELVNSRFDRLEDKVTKRFEPLENRIDTLEDFKGRAIGIFSIISLLGSAVFSWAWGRITKS